MFTKPKRAVKSALAVPTADAAALPGAADPAAVPAAESLKPNNLYRCMTALLCGEPFLRFL